MQHGVTVAAAQRLQRSPVAHEQRVGREPREVRVDLVLAGLLYAQRGDADACAARAGAVDRAAEADASSIQSSSTSRAPASSTASSCASSRTSGTTSGSPSCAGRVSACARRVGNTDSTCTSRVTRASCASSSATIARRRIFERADREMQTVGELARVERREVERGTAETAELVREQILREPAAARRREQLRGRGVRDMRRVAAGGRGDVERCAGAAAKRERDADATERLRAGRRRPLAGARDARVELIHTKSPTWTRPKSGPGVPKRRR